ncbi:ABC transporter substrate-binding protein [Paenibacillus aurantiacus]|uniref:ABC transporter substrate-binding protein n=1 Tax=Paenibacillus aurantiacus TaxID=1936118 RepID=A0ABV5KPA7_9BACL
MKTSKRLTVMLALVMLATAGLSACSSGNSGGNAGGNSGGNAAKTSNAVQNDGAAGNQTTVVKEEEPPKEESLDFGGQPLRIGQWWGMDAYLNDEEKAKQKKVEEKYNTKIEYVTVPDTSSRLITSSVAGEPFADIVMLPIRDAFPKMVISGYLDPIDDDADLTQPAFASNSVTMTNGKFQGKQYGISEPYAETHGLYYDKTLLQQLGLPDPYELQEKGEWTWANLLDILNKVKAAGKVPLYFDSESLLASVLIYSNEGKIEDEATSKIAIDEPNAMEALQFYSDLFNVHKVMKVADGASFGNGDTAFVNGYRWDNLGYVKDKPNDIGYVYFPKGPKASNYVVPYDKMNLWFIPKGVKNPRAVLAAFSELFEFDVVKGKDIKLQKEEPNMKNKESLDTMRKMMDSEFKIINYKAYVGLADVIEEAFKSIASGSESPSTAIARVKPMAQAAIDVTTKK